MGGSDNQAAIKSTNNTLVVKGLRDNNFDILLVLNSEIDLVNKLGVPINGVIGSSFFKNYLVHINYDKQKLYIYKNKEKIVNKIKAKTKAIAVDFDNQKPLIKVAVKEEKNLKTANLLFDTGLSDGLWLFESKLSKKPKSYILDEIGEGISGTIDGKRARLKQLKLNEIEFKNAIVSYPDSVTLKNLEITGRIGSLGGEFIKRFNWYLDYENK